MEDAKQVEAIVSLFEHALEPLGFEIAPFLAGWYDSQVDNRMKVIGKHVEFEDSLLLCIVSTPAMFEATFVKFIQKLIQYHALTEDILDNLKRQNKISKYSNQASNLFDWSVCCQLKVVLDNILGSLECKESLQSIVDLLKMAIYIPDYAMRIPNLLGELHLQTAGHVSGIAHYYTPCDQGQFGVSLHPKYGGWFGFRFITSYTYLTSHLDQSGVFAFPGLRCPGLARQPTCDPLGGDEQLVEQFLREFNKNWQNNKWRYYGLQRDAPIYSREAIVFFNTKPRDRIGLLRQWTEEGRL